MKSKGYLLFNMKISVHKLWRYFVDIFSSPFIPLIIHPRIQFSLQSSTFDLCSNIIQSFNIHGPFRSVSLFVVLRAGKGKGASIVNIPASLNFDVNISSLTSSGRRYFLAYSLLEE